MPQLEINESPHTQRNSYHRYRRVIDDMNYDNLKASHVEIWVFFHSAIGRRATESAVQGPGRLAGDQRQEQVGQRKLRRRLSAEQLDDVCEELMPIGPGWNFALPGGGVKSHCVSPKHHPRFQHVSRTCSIGYAPERGRLPPFQSRLSELEPPKERLVLENSPNCENRCPGTPGGLPVSSKRKAGEILGPGNETPRESLQRGILGEA